MVFDVRDMLLHSPSLEEVVFVDMFLKGAEDDYTYETLIKVLGKKLEPRKVAIILDYLEVVGHILFDPNGFVVYMWNPELLKLLKRRGML